MVLKGEPQRESWITSGLDNTLKGMRYDLDKDSSQYRELCRQVLKATVEYLEKGKEQLGSKYSELELERLYGNRAETNPTEPEHTSDTLEQAYQDYWDEFSHTWKPRTKRDYKGVRKQILEMLGPDTQIHTISYVQLRYFRNNLRSGKMSKTGEPLSIDRVNLFTGQLKGVYELALKKDRKLDPRNPTDGPRLQDKRPPRSKQDVFTSVELKKLFCKSKEHQHDKHVKPANFWVPLLSLLTGARLEELCQLRLEDVKQRDGFWCLDIREDNADRKSVKMVEQRIIPLHPFIVEGLQFPDYAASIDKTKKRVFYELPHVGDRWGHGTTQWFRGFRNRAGVPAPKRKKTFHTLRHTFIDFIKQQC